MRWIGHTLELSGLGWVGNLPNLGNLVNLTRVLSYNCNLGVSRVLKIRKRVPLAHHLAEVSHREAEPGEHFAVPYAGQRELSSPTFSTSTWWLHLLDKNMKTISSVIIVLKDIKSVLIESLLELRIPSKCILEEANRY